MWNERNSRTFVPIQVAAFLINEDSKAVQHEQDLDESWTMLHRYQYGYRIRYVSALLRGYTLFKKKTLIQGYS
jgi:hypothetical protein